MLASPPHKRIFDFCEVVEVIQAGSLRSQGPSLRSHVSRLRSHVSGLKVETEVSGSDQLRARKCRALNDCQNHAPNAAGTNLTSTSRLACKMANEKSKMTYGKCL